MPIYVPCRLNPKRTKSFPPPLSELVLHPPRITDLRHGHDLDHETGPPREVLRALALPRLGVVLLPREARVLPAAEDGVDDVLAQARVQVRRRFLVRARLGGDFLGRHC